jgi:hypothetical protein
VSEWGPDPILQKDKKPERKWIDGMGAVLLLAKKPRLEQPEETKI